jgi:hypothetical protein
MIYYFASEHYLWWWKIRYAQRGWRGHVYQTLCLRICIVAIGLSNWLFPMWLFLWALPRNRRLYSSSQFQRWRSYIHYLPIQAGYLPFLKHLALHQYYIGRQMWQDWQDHFNWSSLSSLEIGQGPISPENLKVMTGRLNNLKSLIITGGDIQNEELCGRLESSWWLLTLWWICSLVPHGQWMDSYTLNEDYKSTMSASIYQYNLRQQNGFFRPSS